MKHVTSADGTRIAVEQIGQGPAVVLVDGAMCRREFGPMRPLAKVLSDRFTVYYYDRRGRGDSEDKPPYRVEREIEDLRAVLEHVGSSACVYGTSSGAALALLAAGSGASIKKLAVFEPPFALDGTRVPEPPNIAQQIEAHLAAGRRDDAMKLFFKYVGVPSFAIFIMRLFPNVWPKVRAVAHTLPYDFAVLGATQSGGPLPDALRDTYAHIGAPTLTLAGGKSPEYMHHNGKVIAQLVRGARFEVVPGQNHNASAKAMAAVLGPFFAEA